MTTRRLMIVLAYAGLILGGWLLGQFLPSLSPVPGDPDKAAGMPWMLVGVCVIYVVASALPFVPGAEIGLALMAAFGALAAPVVYLCMVLALCLAYLAGRLVPPALLARGLRGLGLSRAGALIDRLAAMPPEARNNHMLQAAPGRLVTTLVKHRYIALALVLNLPGNSLLGGGGGLAMVAGMSGVFRAPAFLLTVVIAVAPVPLLVMAVGWSP